MCCRRYYVLQKKIHFLKNVRFFVVNKILFSATSFLQVDKNNNYFYEFIPKRDCDIIDNIKIDLLNKNIKITYHIDIQQYDPQDMKEFIIVASPYFDLIIRLTFLEKPTENFEIFVYLRNYIMKLRKKLRMSRLITNSIIYENGVCQKI